MIFETRFFCYSFTTRLNCSSLPFRNFILNLFKYLYLVYIRQLFFRVFLLFSFCFFLFCNSLLYFFHSFTSYIILWRKCLTPSCFHNVDCFVYSTYLRSISFSAKFFIAFLKWFLQLGGFLDCRILNCVKDVFRNFFHNTSFFLYFFFFLLIILWLLLIILIWKIIKSLRSIKLGSILKKSHRLNKLVSRLITLIFLKLRRRAA